jgi:signal peptidase I
LKRPRLLREIVELIAIAIVLFLVIHFTMQAYQVNDDSMQKTLHSGQNVLVNRVAYIFRAPERGDVIVLRDPTNTDHTLLRRIIGLPGDTITLDSSTITVNGVLLNEPYAPQKFNPGAQSLKVPPDSYFVLPDNRLADADSRYFGPVSSSLIIGKAVMIYWPLNQWHIIDTYPSVYSGVH